MQIRNFALSVFCVARRGVYQQLSMASFREEHLRFINATQKTSSQLCKTQLQYNILLVFKVFKSHDKKMKRETA